MHTGTYAYLALAFGYLKYSCNHPTNSSTCTSFSTYDYICTIVQPHGRTYLNTLYACIHTYIKGLGEKAEFEGNYKSLDIQWVDVP